MKRVFYFLPVSFVVAGLAAACGSGSSGSSFEDAGPDVTEASYNPPILQPDGSLYPGFSAQDVACFKANKNVASCKKCCDNTYPAGRKVFTGALDKCACQPSKCLTDCASYLCANPPVNPPVGHACTTCFQAAVQSTLGNSVPDGGADGGEMGVAACVPYASEICRDSAECQQVEVCREGCETQPLGEGLSDGGGG